MKKKKKKKKNFHQDTEYPMPATAMKKMFRLVVAPLKPGGRVSTKASSSRFTYLMSRSPQSVRSPSSLSRVFEPESRHEQTA